MLRIVRLCVTPARAHQIAVSIEGHLGILIDLSVEFENETEHPEQVDSLKANE